MLSFDDGVREGRRADVGEAGGGGGGEGIEARALLSEGVAVRGRTL